MKPVISYTALSGANFKGVDSVIQAAINSAKTMREKVQLAGVAVLMHAEKHGDYSKAAVLVDGLGNGVNSGALVEWFVEFGGLEIGKAEVDGKKVDTFVGWKGKAYIREKFAEAKCTAWWEFKKQNPYAGFDLADALKKVVKSAEGALAKIDDAESEGDDALAAMLRELISVDADTLSALKKLAK